MGVTYWSVMDGFSYELRVDEHSSSHEIEAEVEYWMEQVFAYDPPDPYRAAILQAIKWMNSL